MSKTLISRGFAVAMVFFLISGCATRNRIQIDDYMVFPQGKSVVGHPEPLHAFVFENVYKSVSFPVFLMEQYPTDDLKNPEFWVTVDGSKYKILVYDNAELEKYFRVSDFVKTHFNNENEITNAPDFIAISMISDHNEDCLDERSLHYQVAVNYLRNLKQAFYKR